MSGRSITCLGVCDMDKVADFEVERQRKACIEALKGFEEIGIRLLGATRDSLGVIERLYDKEMGADEARAIWLMYLYSSLTLAEYLHERYQLNEGELLEKTTELKESVRVKLEQNTFPDEVEP